MSKLEELIQKLCPRGVEYKLFKEVCKFQNGFAFSSSKFSDEGYPILRITNINNGVIENNNFVYFKKEDYENVNFETYEIKQGDVVVAMSGATTGKIGINLTESVYYLNQRVGLFVPNKEVLNNKFMYYWLCSISNEIYNISSGAGAQPNLSSVKMMEFKLPVPPMEVQSEIVRILDNFTLLTAELTAELTARKEQYEYYRNELFKKSIGKKTTLGDICKFVRGPFGGSLKKEIFVESGYVVYEQQNAIYNNLNFRYYVDEIKFNSMKRFEVYPNDLIISCSGTIGRIMVIPKDSPRGIINQALLKLTPIDGVDSYYLKYVFDNYITAVMNATSRGGALKNVPSVDVLKKIELFLPSLEEQQRIVELLDKFETYCSDITQGLPAEIELRKQQYEYYRDKLLTFKEL